MEGHQVVGALGEEDGEESTILGNLQHQGMVQDSSDSFGLFSPSQPTQTGISQQFRTSTPWQTQTSASWQTRSSSPWQTQTNTLSTPSRAHERFQGGSGFGSDGVSISSSPLSRIRGSEHLSSSPSMTQSDILNVEKSRVLEQLRHMTAEVDQLESRLQAAKRRRARAAAAALQKQKDGQDSEIKEMRNILGSVHQISISKKSDGTKADGQPINTPLSGQTISGINIETIRKLQNFTNIAFTSIYNRKISESNEGLKDYRYYIAGVCLQLEFEIDFTVHEPNLNVTDLSIKLPHSIQTELRQFVLRAQSESLLLPFFRTLILYAQMDYDRQTLMNNLARRFPNLVKINQTISRLSKNLRSKSTTSDEPITHVSPAGSGVQTLVFSGPRKSSPELVLHWAIDVTDQGKVIPRVRLLPRMPKKWKQVDEKGTLDAIPMQFVRLMQLKGTEGAVAILLQCIYGPQNAKATEEDEEDEEEEGVEEESKDSS
ncbi:hypothetical protein BX616_000408 [Lobosporangium transversale]|uniref:Uncharacterized protein n=1 Tax=Lobosporangium transversale TaxID=64571 RepID=A0A1Y2GF88_9FUNG|nr:hypothetical protein BCR41DRAFT_358471 [Lobosporangium transversale]KAF9907516.1 hypothetical protein BX616_000408 [Lobosporangium transversale]ORZ09312.1 hypothetical protein BCR41DRAFT_358471 [Lobosporangium transversale]|eukprot:XP_021878765.1 hypothetical protein BCR41DRAFT_358471 [Lobosporangium transversale]